MSPPEDVMELHLFLCQQCGTEAEGGSKGEVPHADGQCVCYSEQLRRLCTRSAKRKLSI